MEVAQAGSFAEVARVHGTAPSSVSRTVALLENELGVRLFQRTTRRLSLTEAGRAYLDRIVPILEELQRAGDIARDLSAVPRGHLRVAIATAFATMYAASWLVEFARRYPEVDVELVLDNRTSDMVRDRIDVALRVGQVREGSAVAVRLCPMDRLVVASPSYLAREPVHAPGDIAGRACLLFPFSGTSQDWRFRGVDDEVIAVPVRARMMVANGVILRDLAMAGLGLTLLPEWMCVAQVAAGQLRAVCPEYAVTATEHDPAVWLLYPSRAYLPLKARVFIDYVRELFRGGPPWLATPDRRSPPDRRSC